MNTNITTKVSTEQEATPFGNVLLGAVTFPKRNTRFKLDDFFQVAVDDFHSGEFLFLSDFLIHTVIVNE